MTISNTHRCETVELPSPVFSSEIKLKFHHYSGANSRPKVYLQAALHADEITGLLVMRKLLLLLDQADAKGGIVGHIVATPIANPLGLHPFHLGTLQGRFCAGNGKNFNRDFPDISSSVAIRVREKLSDDYEKNTIAIRNMCREVLNEMAPQTALDVLRHALLSHSIDADYVFNLHCDFDANLYFCTFA